MRSATDNAPAVAPQAPLALTVLGALGVAPFWLPVLAGVVWPQTSAVAFDALAAYAAIILSFLAGSRLGIAITEARPATTTLCLSMAPPLAAWALVLLPIMSGLRLVLLALALLAHAAWDARADLAPRWYAGLRWRLTFGAMTGLLAGAVVLHD